LHDKEGAMAVVARVTDKINHWSAPLLTCFLLCAFGGKVTAHLSPTEVTLRLEPLKEAIKEDEEIGMRVVFVGGTHETTLVLPAGHDAGGIITYRVSEVASRREWTAAERDSRSFARDSRRRVPAGGKIELLYDALEFTGTDSPIVGNLPVGSLPVGTYRIVCTYDEGKALRPENRTSRVLRSEPVEIVVTAR
jgi:hypothetical protein